MKRFGRIAIALAGGLALNVGLGAPNPAAVRGSPPPRPVVPHFPPPKAPAPESAPVVSPAPNNTTLNDPYADIAERNVFGLIPPPDPNALAAEQAENDLPKITPEGIMGVFGNYQVLFKVGPPKPDPKTKDQFYTLSEGQMQDNIEVVKIDNSKSLVTFNNHGTTQELPLIKEADAGGGAPAGPGGTGPGMPGVPGARGPGGPGGIIRFGANPAFNAGQRGGASAFNGQAGNAPNGGPNFGNSSPQAHIYQPPASHMSPEDAQIILAAQHLKAQQEGSPTAPLFPPSAIDRQVGIQGNTTPPAP